MNKDSFWLGLILMGYHDIEKCVTQFHGTTRATMWLTHKSVQYQTVGYLPQIAG